MNFNLGFFNPIHQLSTLKVGDKGVATKTRTIAQFPPSPKKKGRAHARHFLVHPRVGNRGSNIQT